jgi:lysozyme
MEDNRRIVLIDMCFNLGINGLLEFSNMLKAVEAKRWDEAAFEIENSLAAHQDIDRYQQLAYIMKTGEL